MASISPYDEALQIIKKNTGTGGAGSLAKLVLSLYNPICGYAISECLGNLDDRLTSVALRMVQDYSVHGETDDLRAAGRIIADELYPGLWEMSVAMNDARETTRRKWRQEEKDRETAEITDAEKAFVAEPSRRDVPVGAAEEMIACGTDKVDTQYYLFGEWTNKELPLEKVRAAIREHGTGFLNCNPDSSSMLGVILDGRVYYVYTDYDARERYLASKT